MATPSVNVPDEVLDKFDDRIMEKKLGDELPKNVSRSQIIAELMEEWAEGNSTSTSPIAAD